MVICETPDFAFPMQADIYHPIVEQGVYGDEKLAEQLGEQRNKESGYNIRVV